MYVDFTLYARISPQWLSELRRLAEYAMVSCRRASFRIGSHAMPEPEGSEKYKEVNSNIKRCNEKRLKETGQEDSVVRMKKIRGRTTVRGHTNS